MNTRTLPPAILLLTVYALAFFAAGASVAREATSPEESLKGLREGAERLEELNTALADIGKAYAEVPKTEFEKKQEGQLRKRKTSKDLADLHRDTRSDMRAVLTEKQSCQDGASADALSDPVKAQLQVIHDLLTRDWVREALNRLKKHAEAARKLLAEMQIVLQKGEYARAQDTEVNTCAATADALVKKANEELQTRSRDLTDLWEHYRKLHPTGEISWSKWVKKGG